MSRMVCARPRSILLVGLFFTACYSLYLFYYAPQDSPRLVVPPPITPELDDIPPPPPVEHWEAPDVAVIAPTTTTTSSASAAAAAAATTTASKHDKPGPNLWQERADAVRDAFRHAYRGYEQYGLPNDELRPLSNRSRNIVNGWGLTVFDSLDTMLLMGLDDEYKRGLEFVQTQNYSLDSYSYAPFFETTIRYTGGLLAAYAMTKDEILLKKADELATALEPVFNTTTGLPAYGVNTVDGGLSRPWSGILAEVGSFQMEYSYLAHLTGKKNYFEHVAVSHDLFNLADLRATGGMLPTSWSLEQGTPNENSVSVGGEADSGHEYLLKLYLLTAKTDKNMLDMYIKMTSYVLSKLTFVSPNRHLLYVSPSQMATLESPGWLSHQYEHLACFFPGLLALGAHTLPLSSFKLPTTVFHSLADDGIHELSEFNLHDLHMWAAEGLAQTCWIMYADTETGLGPEAVSMRVADDGEPIRWLDVLKSWKRSGGRGIPPGTRPVAPLGHIEDNVEKMRERDYSMRDERYLLRPETIESVYLMWKTTGDKKWRERGWDMFQALEKHTKTESGYASLQSVENSAFVQKHLDEQPSYFLAETLKYLYLLFDDNDPISLDKWVFNTEAHPLPVFSWSDENKSKFGI